MATSPRFRPVGRLPHHRSFWKRFWVGAAVVVALAASVRAATVEARPPKPYLADTKVVVLAHQGASGHAPSNTIESFRLGMEMGADIIETDVHTTADGVIVTSHDESVDRLTDCKGLIKEKTLAQLRQCDFGFGFTPDGGKTYPYRGKGVQIATLQEVFQTFPDVRVNIEIKQVSPPMEGSLWALIQQYHMADKVLINSFPSEPTDRWQQVTGAGGARVALGADRADMFRFAAYWLPHLDWLYSPDRDAFQIPVAQKVGPVEIRLDTPRLIAQAHKLGIKVHYWTINDEATMRRLIELGADGIITDYPDRAVKVLKEMQG
jgi:glycerophosphoryl diester phosphodiesterase